LRRFAFASVLALSCAPDLHDDPTLVDAPAIVAVRSEPPEVSPGASVNADALVVSKDGTVAATSLAWALCTSPKGPAENGVVNSDCLADAATPVGEGSPLAFAIPSDACALFGPDTPPGNFRPRDPDATGGFYQPIRLRFDDALAVDLERIICNLRTAPADVAAEFRSRYVPNHNPTLRSATASVNPAVVALTALPAGERIDLAVAWNAGDAESYVVFVPGSATLATARETLRVTWYATGGTFDNDGTGPDPNNASGTTSMNVWTAPSGPSAPTRVHFWAVLRDSRGGLDFSAWDGTVVEK
jgi:hypothetical protein